MSQIHVNRNSIEAEDAAVILSRMCDIHACLPAGRRWRPMHLEDQIKRVWQGGARDDATCWSDATRAINTYFFFFYYVPATPIVTVQEAARGRK